MDEKNEQKYLAMQKEMRQFYEGLDPAAREAFLRKGRKEFAQAFEKIKQLIDKTDFPEKDKQLLFDYCLNRQSEFVAILDENKQ